MDNKQQPKADQKQLTVDDAYAQAINHFNATRYTEADKLCTAIIQAVPNHIDAINLLGVIAQKLNRHDLAVEQFQKAVNIDNNRALLLFNLGTSLYPLGRRDEAIQVLKFAKEKEPGNSQITDYLNGVLNNPVSNVGMSKIQNTVEEALQRGMSIHKTGRISEAIHWYQKVLEIQPENTAALSNIGVALQTVGKLDEAVLSYQKAITFKPDYVEAHFNLGNTLKEQGKLEEAVASYQKAITFKPDYEEAHSNLGVALQEQGKLEEAVTSCKKAISITPDSADAHSNLGFVLQEQGKLEEAVTSYQKAISIKPDSKDFVRNLESSKGEMIEDFIINLSSNEKSRSLNATQLISEDLRDKTLKVNLLYCPFADPITPPLGIASLKAYLEDEGNVQVHCVDLNLEWHLKKSGEKIIKLNGYCFQPGLEELQKGEKFFKNSHGDFFNVEKYRSISSNFIAVLHKSHFDNQYALTQDDPHQKKEIISDLMPLALHNSPDIIGFSILFDSQILCSLLLAKEIKKKYPKKIVVFGGAGLLSSFNKIINNPYVDFVLSDAGEASFNELLQSIQSGKFNDAIPGVAYKTGETHIKNKPAVSNLKNNAYPDFSDLDLDKYFTSDVVIPILSSKGCFWRRCSFCEEGNINLYSVVDLDRVVDEIEHHYSNGHCYFQFVDEMISPKRLRMLSKKIISKNISVYFYATLRPSADFNAETLELMHTAGFRYVIWGVESCNPRVLKLVNKGTTVESISNTLKLSTKAGIKNHIFMFIGFPTETPDELFDTMQFIYDHRRYIHTVHYGKFGLCRGTEIFNNPEKFEITIKPRGVNNSHYMAKHKKGTTGEKAKQYFDHYVIFLKQFATAPEFGILRDHALLFYARYSLHELEEMRKNISSPVPMENTSVTIP